VRLPASAHTAQPWRIHEIAPDFRLEDVWALPTRGGPDDFPRLVQLATTLDPAKSPSRAVRALFAIRWKAGELLGWDDESSAIGSGAPSLRDRLPANLRDSPRPAFDPLPFTCVYMTGDELAAEVANRTVHGILHLGWVEDEAGGYRGQMAVLVKPNGLLGAGYMAAIKPFRYAMVYPRMLREFGERWEAGDPVRDRRAAP
jgi:Protein of unknown function (DUF2867)